MAADQDGLPRAVQPAMKYLSFIRGNLRFLSFGFVLAVASSFGQTFFIALFGAEIRDEFGLTHGSFGALYSAATLGSGLTIMWAGSVVDRFDLRPVSAAVSAGLIGACFTMAIAPAIPVLFAALFALRFTGQGLLGHVSATSMARYFPDGSRGKALSLASLGHPAGEAAFPAVTVAIATAIGWRETWAALGCVLVATLIPASLWLLRGHGARHRSMLARVDADRDGGDRKQWRRAEVLRDPRFYAMLPAVLAPAFINTGIFFHQAHLAEIKGWSLARFASGFAVYAVATVGAALGSGGLVDRVGAVRLMPAFLPPLGLGLLVLGASSHPAVAYVYMALAGITQGSAATVVQSMWAERYGVRHLGAIRSLAMALMVLSTSLSPALLGALIDAGTAMETLILGMSAYTALAFAIVIPACRRPPRARRPASA